MKHITIYRNVPFQEDEFADFIVEDDGEQPRQRRPMGAARRRADLGHIPAAALRVRVFGKLSQDKHYEFGLCWRWQLIEGVSQAE